MFVGRHERQLDQKGRLALPAGFRARFENGCYLAYGAEGCIDVFTPEAFEAMATETLEKVKRGEMTRAEQRALASAAFLVNLDSQGRITIDRELREFARLEPGSTAMVAGSFDRAEIWRPDLYAAQTAQGTARIVAGG